MGQFTRIVEKGRSLTRRRSPSRASTKPTWRRTPPPLGRGQPTLGKILGRHPFPLPPIYTGGERGQLNHNPRRSALSLPLVRFSSRSVLHCMVKICRISSTTISTMLLCCRRTQLPLRPSCWIKKADIILELYVC
ncbi:hypothetical protein D1007_00889 [Hordeum vulgare]|nr:hypothetical protein D1007_00889 [Hordeum vulgare]